MAISAEQLNIILSAKDREFAKAMERNQRRVQQFASRSQRNLGRTSRAMDSLGAVARRLGPILAAALSVRAVQNAANYAQELKSLSTLAGVSASELQALGAASRTVGISTEKLADIYKDMNDRIGDFLQTGGGPMKDFFETIAPAVGVTAENFERLSGPQALQLFVSSLEKANLTQAEMVFYLEAMASDSSALIPLLRENGSEMSRLATEARNAGRVLEDDAVTGLADLNEELQSASDEIRTSFLTALTSSQNELIALSDFVRDFGVPAFEALLTGAATAANAIRGVAEAIGLVNAMRTGEMGQYVDPENILPGFKSDSGAPAMTADQARELYGPGVNIPPEAEDTAPSGSGPLQLGTIDGSEGSGRSPVRPDLGGGGKGADNARKRLIADYERLLDVLEPATAASREYAEQRDLINKLTAEGIITEEKSNALLEAASDKMKAAAIEASALHDAMQGVQSSIEDAFMSMIDGTATAEEAFKAMARDIIKQLFRVLVVQRLVGSFAPGGCGLMGSIYGAVAGRASGGSVQAGKPYMVGENGPEPFIPAENGRILSTAQAKAAMGGGSGSVVVNQEIYVSTGVQQTVRTEIKTLMPQIADAAKAAVADAKRRGEMGFA